MKKKEITKETTISEILIFPEAEKILLKYNLPCLWCPFAKMESNPPTSQHGKLKIGQICQMYGIDTEKLLKELNEKIK